MRITQDKPAHPPKKVSEQLSLALAGLLVVLGLSLASLYSILLFHSLAEIFFVVVAFSILIIAWNSRPFMENSFLTFIGVAYLFIGLLVLAHLLTYPGIEILVNATYNTTTQLWIGSRYLLALTFLLAPVFIRRSMPFGVYLVVFFALTLAIFATIFIWPIFPTTYTSSLGLTPFKIYSEYAVAIALFIAVLLLLRKRRALDKDVTRWIAFSISLTILSELFLTFPAHLTDLSNIIGHLLAILSAFLIYLAIVQTGLTHPFSLLFHDLKQSQLALKKERDFISAILDTAGALVVVMTPKGRIIRCNRACEELTGYSFAELRGRYAWNVGILPGEPDSIRAAFDEQQIDRLPPRFEGELTTRDKRRVRIEWSNAILLDPQNAVEFVITTGIDTTARYQAEDHLRYLSSHDTLTGLYNRAYFETEMDRLAHSRKFPVSILMIDLDGLKAINDRHGHPAGDEVLRQAAEVLKASFRSEDVVARIGGDEFGVLLAEASAEVVDQAMLRVQENLLTYNTINRDLPVELSMGAATATSPALLPSSLSRADQAMYRAKKNKQRNQGQG